MILTGVGVYAETQIQTGKRVRAGRATEETHFMDSLQCMACAKGGCRSEVRRRKFLERRGEYSKPYPP